jgi:hypothetical protein
MAYDYEAALKAGASEDDVLNYLTQTRHYDVQGALKAGANKQQVIQYLSTTNPPDYQPEKKGLVRNIAEAAAKPFAKFGVAAYNVGKSTYDLVSGQGAQKANQDLSASRNLPFLGKTDPSLNGNETLGQGVKKIVGNGLEIGSYFVGGEGLGQVGKATLKGLIARGAIQGAKYGALAGGLSGVGSELQNDNASVKSVLEGGAFGTLTGGLTGGVLGGASAAAGKIVRNGVDAVVNKEANKLAKVSREAYDVVSPELSKSEKITALNSGRGTKSPSGEIIIKPSQRDLQVAKVSEGLVSKSKTSVENIASLHSEIEKEANATVAGLKKSDAIFNNSQLSTHLDSVERPPLLASDERLNSAYDLARKKFLEFVNKQPKKLSGLLQARKDFDQWAQKAFPHIFDDPSQAPLQQALRDMRSAANDFISNKLPDGSPFKASLKKQNLLYEAVDNIANKSYKDVGTNKVFRAVKTFEKKHPVVSGVIKYGIPTTGVVGAGAAAFKKLSE